MSKVKQKREEQKREFSITPVKELPPSTRKISSFYNDILDNCMADEKNKIFEISVKDKHWKSIYAPLDIKIMNRKLPLKIFVRVKEGKLYLKKYDSFEDMLKERKTHKKKSKEPEKSK
jgi:hypothetical protein